MEMVRNTKGEYFTARKKYIESLGLGLAAMRDFGAIEYARTATTDEEVVKISDTIGGCVFMDVTALPADEILKDVARIILNDEIAQRNPPQNLITDIEKKRAVSHLFKGGKA